MGEFSKILMALGGIALVGGILLLLYSTYCGGSSRESLRFASATDSETEEESGKSWSPISPPFVIITGIVFVIIVAVALLHHGSTLSNGDSH